MAKVSVIMPVYNCEHVIRKGINSVLEQTYKDFELIIVNDGSIDKTGEISDEFSLKDNRIKVIYQKNSGPSVARNTGIVNSTGDYIMFIDADDTYVLNMIERMVEQIENNQVDFVICGIKKYHHKNWEVYAQENVTHPTTIWEDKATILGNLEELLNSGLFNSPVNKIYKSNKIRQNKINMDESLDIGEDFLFNLNYLKYSNSLSIISDNLYNYYIGENYLTTKYRENMFEMRKSNIIELKNFYKNNGVSDETIYFLYIKLAYACFIQLFHKNNNLSFSGKLDYIKNILKTNEVSDALTNVNPKGFLQKMLVLIMKTDSSLLIYYISKLMNIIRKNNLVNWKRTSV